MSDGIMDRANRLKNLHMNKLVILFLLSLITISIGAVFKIMHWPLNGEILLLGLLLIVVFDFLALKEIYQSTISITEKIMWSVGMLFAWFITAIIYLTMGRNRILKQTIIKN